MFAILDAIDGDAVSIAQQLLFGLDIGKNVKDWILSAAKCAQMISATAE